MLYISELRVFQDCQKWQKDKVTRNKIRWCSFDALPQNFKWSSFSVSSWARGRFNPFSKSFILSFEVTFTRWEINKTRSKFTHNKTPIMFQCHCFRSLSVKANVSMKFQNLVKHTQFWRIFRYKLSRSRTQKLTKPCRKTDAFH